MTSPRQTRLCRSNGIWPVTMHGETWRQCRRQSPRTLSRTQIMKIGDVISVADFHDLCSRHVRDFVGNLSLTLSQMRNGVMEFGLNGDILLSIFNN